MYNLVLMPSLSQSKQHSINDKDSEYLYSNNTLNSYNLIHGCFTDSSIYHHYPDMSSMDSPQQLAGIPQATGRHYCVI